MMPSSMYHKNTSLIVKSPNFIDFDSKHGLIFRAFFVVFFVLQVLSPGAVALLRTMVFL